VGTITTRPPCSSAPHISHTEKSKAYEWACVHTSSLLKRICSAMAVNMRSTLAWLSPTPFGLPVEPDV
jgi:hypothetical protein